MPGKNILILNTHSFLNLGDAGIYLAQIQLLRKYFPSANISVTSRTPDIDQPFYERMGIRVFPPIIPSPGLFTGTSQKIEKSLKNLLNLGEKSSLVREVKRSNIVISSGGGYLYSNRKIFPGPTFLQHVLHILLAILFDRPVLLYPQSIGPFCNPVAPFMLKRIFQSSSVVKIFAREEFSFEWLLQFLGEEHQDKVDLCPDLALAMENSDFGGRKQTISHLRRPILGVNLRDWNFPEFADKERRRLKREAYMTGLVQFCKAFMAHFSGSIVILPQVKGPEILENDGLVTKELCDRMGGMNELDKVCLVDPDSLTFPCDLMNLFSQVDLVLATRFHSTIFSLLSGRPAISISYLPKHLGTMKLLKLEEFCMDITDINPKRMLRLTEEILDHPVDIKERIRTGVNQARRQIGSKLANAIKAYF